MPAKSAKFISALHTNSVTVRAKDYYLIVGLGERTNAGGVNIANVVYTGTFLTKLVALYPMIGNTTGSLFMNFVTPGTNATVNNYMVTDIGTPVANDGYISYSGNTRLTLGYAKSAFNINSSHLYYYSNAGSNSVSDVSEMGAQSAITPYYILRINFQNTGSAAGFLANTSGSTKSNTVANIDMAVNRRRSDTVDIVLAGVVSSFAQASSACTDGTLINIGCGFNNQFTTKPCRGAAFGAGLAIAETAEEHNVFVWMAANK
jgi:hypothetical protein